MDDTEITYKEVLEWLKANGKNAAWLAKTLGVSPSTPSRWSKGDPIPPPMQTLLRVLLRGEIPDGFATPSDRGILSFSPEEWRVMELARAREGFDDTKEWIVHKIRAYLAMANIKPGPIPYESHEAWQARQESLRVAEGEK